MHQDTKHPGLLRYRAARQAKRSEWLRNRTRDQEIEAIMRHGHNYPTAVRIYEASKAKQSL